MNDINTVKAERTDLDLHVDLCAQRYAFLEESLRDIRSEFQNRSEKLEKKMGEVVAELSKSKATLSTTIVTSSAMVVTSVLGLVVTIFMKM
jgi:hypothetical protein